MLVAVGVWILFVGAEVSVPVWAADTTTAMATSDAARERGKCTAAIGSYLYGVLENFGYRQINSFCRLQAVVRYPTGWTGWGHVHHRGARPAKGGRP